MNKNLITERDFSQPKWDDKTGLIQPVYPGRESDLYKRSPYRVTPEYFVKCFGINDKRIKLLKLFFDFRARIYRAGVCSGFQWVNGSFVENKEKIKDEEPNDIDVVTFVENEPTEKNLLLNPFVKRLYLIDSYWIVFSKLKKDELVYWIAYWYSLWGHQRNSFQWKGFLEIPLNEELDANAVKLLNQKENV